MILDFTNFMKIVNLERFYGFHEIRRFRLILDFTDFMKLFDFLDFVKFVDLGQF